MGSYMRTREAIALGENENRRLTDIIESGNTAGWHTFEQSLVKAYEEDLITEESALLYCVSRTQMRQRLDAVHKKRETGPGASTLKMKVEEKAHKAKPAPRPAPVAPAPVAPAPVAPAPVASTPELQNPNPSA